MRRYIPLALRLKARRSFKEAKAYLARNRWFLVVVVVVGLLTSLNLAEDTARIQQSFPIIVSK